VTIRAVKAMTPTEVVYERRVATLRRLGAEIHELTCHACQDRFVDPEPLGGLAWKIIFTDDRGRRAGSKYFCSEPCAQKNLDKHRGSTAAWIEGYEPPKEHR
jgi:hypothetical protein